MNKPVEQALSNLIPRHSGALPEELLELASSLLAQSRSKASNLRAEEEIGRTYACANIACERLKTSLNLPLIEPRPPLPPRVYSKLYQHLDKTLVSGTPRKRQKTVLNSTLGSSAVHKALPQRQTPTKDRALDPWRNRKAPNPGLQYGNNNKDAELPNWMLYVIRLLCRQMQTRKAIPHVIAGVESVLFSEPPARSGGQGKKQDFKMEGKQPALIGAVWFFVSCRMLAKDLNGREYVSRRNVLLDVLREMSDDENLKYKIRTQSDAAEAWEEVGEADLKLWMNELAEKGWIDMDWFLNIQKGEIDGVVEQLETDQEVQWYSSRSREELRQAGLGSMITQKYEFLSEDNRKAYKQWRKMILIKVDEMIRDGALEEPPENEGSHQA